MSLLQQLFYYFWPTQPIQPTQTESIDTQTESIETQTESIETQTETIETQTETIETQTETIDSQTEKQTIETSSIETRTNTQTLSEVSFEDETHSNKKYVYICTVTLANMTRDCKDVYESYESYEEIMFIISDETYNSPEFKSKFNHMFFRYLVCNSNNNSQLIKDIIALYNSDLEQHQRLISLINVPDYDFIGYLSECNLTNIDGSIFEEMYSDILDEFYRIIGSFDEMKKYFLDNNDDGFSFEEIYPTSINRIEII